MRKALIIAFAAASSLLVGPLTAIAGPPHVAPQPAKAKPPTAAKKKLAATPVHRFEGASQKTVAAWLDTLQGQLETYLRDGSPAASKPLLARAYTPKRFAPLLANFRGGATRFGATRVKLNGVEVRVTLWHHRIPMRDVELYFWRVDKSSFELLRLVTAKSIHRFFGGPAVVSHTTGPGLALRALAKEVLALAQEKRCAALPTVKTKHLDPFLPKMKKAHQQTLFQFHKHRFRQEPQCRALGGVPFTHVTFRVGDVGGVLLDKGGERYAFKLSLAAHRDAKAGERRELGLRTIIAPVSPKHYQPRGLKLKGLKAKPKKRP